MIESVRTMLALFLGLAWLLWTVMTLWRQHRTGPFAMSDTLVAYASQTGTAQSMATEFAQRHNLQPPLALGKLSPNALAEAKELHCFVSTYGDGEPPDNGRKFAKSLNNLNTGLSELSFHVTALGDRRYPDFCAFGHLLYERLQSHGATPLGAITCVDASEANQTDNTQYRNAELVSRQYLNPHSDAPGLYALMFAAPDCCWQAGDWLDVRVPDPANPSAYLSPRTYSVASAGDSKTLRLIVRHLIKSDGQSGLASHFLTHTLTEGEYISVRVRQNPAMTLTNCNAPLLLIGAGSGLAGLLGVIETLAQRAVRRPIWLIYGERDPHDDRPYADKLDAWLNTGVIAQMNLVFSRQRPMATTALRYCQDVLLDKPAAVSDFLGGSGHILVCGSLQGMGSSVDQALRDILGDACLEAMAQHGRYHRDLY
ncbi:NADPH cytochrome P450 oxidoreductase family protein [Alteromonas halophila]|uniref:NADPH--hemoprotein reductase n=1 Tax=Alteromonas halophila TaxID=516698 RepID=A0A918JQG0_9ALTE|nr:NADPH cytochrome P450 oxidoreductase family protein [Alteromonas halophila]GGW92799.1 oxidoreductase [Alteromonas halophila]